MSRFSSIDPVGILKAWTTKVRMNSARMTAMTIDSKYSRRIDFLKPSLICVFQLSNGFAKPPPNLATTADTEDRRLRPYTNRFRLRVPGVLCGGERHSAICLSTFVFRSHLQHREERFLRDFHFADALHALLACLLLLEQLALARDVAAVALGEHVLAQRLHRFAGDDAAADGRL